jgi:Ca2+-binding EF-hand superfamily protein
MLLSSIGLSEELVEQPDDTRNLVFLGDDSPIFIRLHIRVDQASYRFPWNANADALFYRLDRDKDKTLNSEEAKGIPSAQSFMNRNPYFGLMRQPGKPDTADADKNGKVDREELAAHLRKVGGGEFAVQTEPDQGGQSPAIDEMIFARLDMNNDGRLTKEEFDLSDALRKLDNDDDETIGLQELNPLLLSPYAQYTRQPSPKSDHVRDLDAIDSSQALAQEIVKRYSRSDQDGLSREQLAISDEAFEELDRDTDAVVNANELTQLLANPSPAAELVVWMGGKEKSPRIAVYGGISEDQVAKKKAQAAFNGLIKSLTSKFKPSPNRNPESVPHSLQEGNDKLDLVVKMGGSQFGRPNNTQIYKQQFAAADGDNNKYLDEQEGRRNGFFNQTFAQMDQNGDGQLYEDEMIEFVRAQERTASSRVLMSVTDRGRGLFSVLDSNSDKRVTRRELMQAATNIKKWDKNEDGAIELTEIPRQWKLSFSQAQSNPFGVIFNVAANQMIAQKPAIVVAPSWFRKMDRNSDGDLSAREFLGPRDDFVKLDGNSDGLISADEARKGLVETKVSSGE